MELKWSPKLPGKSVSSGGHVIVAAAAQADAMKSGEVWEERLLLVVVAFKCPKTLVVSILGPLDVQT